MTDISERLSNLSAEKRELLLRQLNKKGESVSRIEPRSKDSQSLPLSFSQQRLWFLDQFESGNAAYNIPVILHLAGTLNVDVLEQTLSEIVTRHESLRTTFIDEDGKPVQRISPSGSFSLPITDLRNLPEIERERAARRISTEETMRLFDLADGPLFRFALLQLSEEQFILIAVMHHIISDGWSEGLFIQELQTIYQAILHGKPSPLPELPIQYADFAQWQRQWLQGEVLDSQLSFWEKQLTGAPPILEFPTDKPRPTVQTFHGSEQSLNLSKSLHEALEALSRQENATLFMALLTAFKILLYRYTGQGDLVVGTPIANRDRVEIEGLIGFFVNTLALRTNISGEQSFRQLLNQVREMTLEAYAHQNLPFEKLVEVLQPERSLSHSPFFQVMFVLQNYSSEEIIELPDLTLTRVRGECKTAKFDLTLEVLNEATGLKLYFEYNTDLFEAATITRLMGHFKNLLESIVVDPDQRISGLSLLSDVEKNQLLVGWNDTEAEYPLHLCLHQLFEEQVERTPDAIALRYEGVELTYREFDHRSNQLARHLRKLGVGPEVLVGVFMERSIEMVVSLYGILKAGGAYVPLDPEYPPERIGFMLEDTQVPVILTQERLVSKLPKIQANILCLDTERTTISQESVEQLKNEATPENLAYVIFTSGSTGRPKGAMNTHRGICNRLHWMQTTYQLNQDDRILQKTPFSFDVSVWEFFWPLLFGAQLVVSRPGGHKDSSYLINLIVEQGITTIHFVPSMLQLFLENKDVKQCLCLKRVICSGEALPYELTQRFFAELKSELHNLYGPTEAAVDVSYWKCGQDNKLKIVPIGRPVANTQLYILDKSMHPVPIGVAGELHIGGIQVARGYLNRPELTAKKFIPDPFSKNPEAHLYKTGDSVRFLPDGNIEFLGRLDFQVKVRGFRIELGEIESVLSQHPAVREVVVLAREDVPGDIRLAAYFISMDQSSVNIGKLRNYLKEKLPDYMVPAAYVQLETMPLNPNGKVDRRSLPVPKSEGLSEKAFVAPQNEMEKIIANIWQELLQVEKVGIDDNFFDMGGHSLLIMQAHRKLSNSIEKEITITDMFRFPTIRTLSTYMVQDSGVTDQATIKKSVDRAQARREALRRRQQRRK